MSKDEVAKPLNIYQRIHALMADVGYIQKAEKKDGMNYRAVMHDDVVAKVRPYFVQHGIVMAVSCAGSITREWDATDKYKNVRHYTLTEVECDISFINIDDPADRSTVKSFGIGIDEQDKGPGKAISYAVKYAVLKNFFFESGDDPDQDQGPENNLPADLTKKTTKELEKIVKKPADNQKQDKEYAKRVNDKLKDQQLKIVDELGQKFYADLWAEQKGVIASKYNVGMLSDCTTKQLEAIIKRIKEKIDQCMVNEPVDGQS